MIRISIRDIEQSLYIAHQEGRKAILNKHKNPHVSNPYLEGTDVAKAWDEGVREELEKIK